MTALRQRAFILLAEIPEERLNALIQYMEDNRSSQEYGVASQDRVWRPSKREAYHNLEKYFGRISGVVDYKKELEEALWKKYESIG